MPGQGHLNLLRMMYYPDIEKPAPLVRFSRRLLKAGGYINGDLNRVTIAKGLYNEYGPEEVIEAMGHELIHWALGDIEERPHGPTFRAEAERLGVALVGPEHSLHKRRKSKKVYTYVCPQCGATEKSKRQSVPSCAVCYPEGYNPKHLMALSQREVRV